MKMAGVGIVFKIRPALAYLNLYIFFAIFFQNIIGVLEKVKVIIIAYCILIHDKLMEIKERYLMRHYWLTLQSYKWQYFIIRLKFLHYFGVKSCASDGLFIALRKLTFNLKTKYFIVLNCGNRDHFAIFWVFWTLKFLNHDLPF